MEPDATAADEAAAKGLAEGEAHEIEKVRNINSPYFYTMLKFIT